MNFDIVSKVFAIIAGISSTLGLFFLLKDRLTWVAVRITFARYPLPVQRDAAGGFIDFIVPVVHLRILNFGGQPINIYRMDILLNKKVIDQNIHSIYAYPFRDGKVLNSKQQTTISPGRSFEFVYYGEKIIAAIPKEEKIKLQVRLTDELAHTYHSNTIHLIAANLRDHSTNP